MQLREDVTRFRYGDEQHLDEALTRIFQFGRQKGIPRRSVGFEPSAPCVTCSAHRDSSHAVTSKDTIHLIAGCLAAAH